MKNNLKKLGLLTIATFGLLASCDSNTDDDVLSPPEETIVAQEVRLADETDLISEEVTNVVEDVFAADELSSSGRGPFMSDFLPDCVTITKVVTNNMVEKTIEFEGDCELPNGNVFSGTIHMSYENNPELQTRIITYSLEDFVFNGIAVEGSATIRRTRSNENGVPQSVVERSFEATWPDGSSASFSGTRTREWIAGYGSGVWADNVFLIIGNGTFVSREGITYTKEITTPLRRELSCRFIVSGVLEMTRNNLTASIDFGDGTCDDVAILTKPNGETEEINLSRFR
ncbi:hypothetical protein [Leptobacterium sp. I13]|uniref:hypothetical protein n=1 Tax=Leptobacterium meishanense TaxID=3128904 RepID=UPI0030EFA140